MLGSLQSQDRIEFTYSTPSQPIHQRGFIKTVEAIGRDFFQAAVDLMQLRVAADERALDRVPKTGPVVFVANHPYGVLDGIVLTWLARKSRPDVKVIANHVLCQAPDAKDNLLPIDFSGTETALKTNIETRKTAIKSLEEGGAVGIFPAGGVAVSLKPYRGPAVDTAWHSFAAKMINRTGATVVPVYFGGQNSRLFQIASHLSPTLRLSLFFYETARRIGSEVEFVVGDPITPEEIKTFENRDELTRALRMRTFSLASNLTTPKGGHPQFDREFSFPKHMKF